MPSHMERHLPEEADWLQQGIYQSNENDNLWVAMASS